MPKKILSDKEIKEFWKRQGKNWGGANRFLKHQLMTVVEAYQKGNDKFPEKTIGSFNWAWIRAHLPKPVVNWFESNIKSEEGKKLLRKEKLKQTDPKTYERLYYPAPRFGILSRIKEQYSEGQLRKIWGKKLPDSAVFSDLVKAYDEGKLSKGAFVKRFKELDKKLDRTKKLYKEDKAVANSSQEYLVKTLEADRRNAVSKLTSKQEGVELLRELIKEGKKKGAK